MNDELKTTLMERCGAFLAANGVKPKSVTGRKMIHAFWYGALVAIDQPDQPWVALCLLSGRHDELVKMP